MTLKTRGSPDQKDLFFASCHAKVKLLLQTLSQAVLKFSNNENHVLMSLQCPSPRYGTLFWLWTHRCNLTKKYLILIVSFQDSMSYKWVWVILEFGTLFCSKNVSCFDGETHNVSSIHKTKPTKTTHLLRKGEKTTCIRSVLAHLTKVIASISKPQSSPLLCRVPAARYSAPLEVTVLCSSSSFWVHRLWGALIWERRGTYRNCKVPQTQI